MKAADDDDGGDDELCSPQFVVVLGCGDFDMLPG